MDKIKLEAYLSPDELFAFMSNCAITSRAMQYFNNETTPEGQRKINYHTGRALANFFESNIEKLSPEQCYIISMSVAVFEEIMRKGDVEKSLLLGAIESFTDKAKEISGLGE